MQGITNNICKKGAMKIKKFKQFLNSLKDTPAEEGNHHDEIPMAVAVLFLEIAKSDYDFSDIEREKIEELLVRRYQLTSREMQELIESAQNHRGESFDLWQYTSLLKGHFTKQERIDLVEALWEIIFADGVLDQYEDYIIHKLSELLGINHPQMIEAKLRAKHKTTSHP